MIRKSWTRQKTWLLIALVILGGLALLFTSHNQQFYRQPIAQVVQAKTISHRKVKDEFENIDHQYTQQLKLKVLNGHYQGKTLMVQNTYSDSQPMDQRYKIGNQVFLTKIHRQDGQLTATIQGYKRDTVLVFLIWLVVFMLLLLMGNAGLLALISVIINTILFFIAIIIDLQLNGNHVILLFSILAVIFTFVSLLLVLGWSEKMLATFAATVIGAFAALGVSLL